MTVSKIEARADAGFNYPYFLYVPDDLETDASDQRTLLVQPTSTYPPSDDFNDHLETAETRVDQGFSRGVADELSVPLVHPVFPRPLTEPVDVYTYVHSLDAATLELDDGPLERVDCQLLAMVDDARDRLVDRGIETEDRFSLDGFSAAGAFANRFAALHPERVRSVSAGGVNGMVTLPLENAGELVDLPPGFDAVWDGTLPYPVGVADVEALAGRAFDREAFCGVPQFIYLGEDDDSDPLRYPDAWTEPERRAAAIFTYGEDIHDERFPTCEAVYEEVGVPAAFRTYPDTGHTPGPAFDDVVAFHRRAMADGGTDPTEG